MVQNTQSSYASRPVACVSCCCMATLVLLAKRLFRSRSRQSEGELFKLTDCGRRRQPIHPLSLLTPWSLESMDGPWCSTATGHAELGYSSEFETCNVGPSVNRLALRARSSHRRERHLKHRP